MSTHSPVTGSATKSSGVKSSSAARRRTLFVFVASFVIAVAVLSCPLSQNALAKSSTRGQTVERSGHRSTSLHPVQTGYWHTEGSRIVDAHGATVRISGVNWSGFETVQAVPGGLKAQDYRVILKSIRAAGYNSVRIPFSNQMVEQPTIPSDIAFENASGPINTDLADLDSLQILDRIIAAAGETGLKVILDNHRSEAGSSAEANGLWYTEQYPESAWVADWVSLAERYKNNATVIGFDLRNEPHNATQGGSCWSCGGANDWHAAATRAGDAVLRANSHLLIFVEGTDTAGGESDFWGGNLAGVRSAPVRLSVPGRLVYSAHVYGPTEYQQSWFNAATTPASLAALWQRHWGYISESGMAPVWISEFGTPNNDADVASTEPGSEGQWFQAFIAYLAAHPNVGWSYWGINGEDRYGLLDAAYHAQPANILKARALASVSQPAAPAFERAATPASFAPAAQTVSLPPAPAVASSASYTVPAIVYTPSAAVPMVRPARSSNYTSVGGSKHAAGSTHLRDTAVEGSVAEQVRLATQKALSGLQGAAE